QKSRGGDGVDAAVVDQACGGLREPVGQSAVSSAHVQHSQILLAQRAEMLVEKQQLVDGVELVARATGTAVELIRPAPERSVFVEPVEQRRGVTTAHVFQVDEVLQLRCSPRLAVVPD